MTTRMAFLIAVFAVLLLLVTAASAAGMRLGLAQAAAGQGCIAQPEDEAEAVKGCGRGKGLIDATFVTISPDGASAYVAASGSSAVAAFARDGSTGRLAQRNCVSANGTSGIDGTKGACADGDALTGATAVAVSPDGKFVYAASYDSGGIAVFARNATTGALRQVGCVRAVRTCVSARALSGAAAIALSPDGANAYVAASGSDSVVMLKRDTATGVLAQLGCISDDGHDRLCTTGNALRGADALVVSSDGRQVYVAAGSSNAVLTFARDPGTGLLRQRGCIMQDAPRRGSCTPGKGLEGPTALALSPDGRTIFAASYGSNAVAVFARDLSTGALRWIGCESDVDEDEDEQRDGCGHGRPLRSPTGIAVSPGGDRLYVSGESGLTVLDRNRATGTLAVGGCLTYREYYDEDVTKACDLATGVADASGVAVSPDGHNVYVTSWGSDAVTVLAPGPSMSPAQFSARDVLSVRLSCPALHKGDCAGRVKVTPDAPLRRLEQSTAFRLSQGRSGVVHLRLSLPVQRAIMRRRTLHATIAATDASHALAPTRRLLVLRRRTAHPRPHVPAGHTTPKRPPTTSGSSLRARPPGKHAVASSVRSPVTSTDAYARSRRAP
jgi:DNA-binding beta-propeller fold protein YncE